jgi:nitrite reductase/ring-hydroxylating ferredoxin subunit
MPEDDFVFALDENELEEDTMKLVKVAGQSILLAKHGGKVFGVSNKCPHMGCSLANGKLNEYIVTCPCHCWRFDIRNGQYLAGKHINLTCCECKIENGKIHLKILDDM